ncbi:SDR family NAD(P)-dependent oxidoreductase [Streptomyces prasinus]
MTTTSHDLTGRVAVVTGGASGIGKGVATRLRDAGATVVISDIDQETLRVTADELGVSGIRADVTKAEDIQALADAVLAEHKAVHIVVNNAGVGSMGRVADLTLADWRWMLEVNLWGVIHGVHSFLPLLRSNAEGGHIINTASMAGLVSLPNMAAYGVSKMGVVALTEVLAQECAEDGGRVKASVLCPGPVRSNIKDSLRSRPVGDQGGLFDVDAESEGPMSQMRWMDPLEVGDLVLDTLADGRLYIITHPELKFLVEMRSSALTETF